MLKAIHKKHLSRNDTFRKTKLLKINLRNGKGKVFRYSNIIPVTSVTMLAGVLTVSGFIPGSLTSSSLAHAEGSTGTVDLTANVTEAGLLLTLTNTNVALNLSPAYRGEAFDGKSTTVTVSTDGNNGYSLLMYGEPNLVSGNNIITPTDTCTGGCSNSTLKLNSWGFGVTHNANDTVTYGPMSTGYNVIDSYGEAANGRASIVNFGARVNYTQNPGVYSTTLNFAAVANVTTPIYMQDFNGTYCGTDGPTLVTDSRDNKEYLVQRLADGKCWMLDNLAFDPTNSNTIVNEYNTNASATTLDILKKGVYNETTNPSGVNLEGTGLDNTSGKYASSGITANPNITATAGLWGPTIGESTCNGLSDQSVCTDNWTVPRVNTSRISNYQYPAWSPNSTSADHASSIPSYGSYNIGVYYNYCAASAGSYCYENGSAPGADPQATEDICPSGWRLPTGGDGREFQILYDSDPSYATPINSISDYMFRAVFSAPFSGTVNSSSGAVIGFGTDGFWWPSTRSNAYSMYDLRMNVTGVNTTDNGSRRSHGMSVRCVLN